MSSWLEHLIAAGIPHDTAVVFVGYHRTNPEIWPAFEARALQIARSGIPHFGSRCIMENVRFTLSMEKRSEYKINDHFTPYYARAFMIKHPEYKGFFETRRVEGIGSLKEAA